MSDGPKARVIAERERRGWSIRTAAKAGGVSNTAWTDYESGKRRLSQKMQQAVSTAYGWDIGWPTASRVTPTLGDDAHTRLVRIDANVEALMERFADLLERLPAIVAMPAQDPVARDCAEPDPPTPGDRTSEVR